MKQTSWTGLSSGLKFMNQSTNRSQGVKLNCFLPEKRLKKIRIRNPDSRHWLGHRSVQRERLHPSCIVGTALVRLPRAVSSRLQNKQQSIFQEWTRESLIKGWGTSPELETWNPPEREQLTEMCCAAELVAHLSVMVASGRGGERKGGGRASAGW